MRDEPSSRSRVATFFAGRPLMWATVSGLALVVIGLTVFFGLLDSVVERDDISLADRPVLSWLAANRGPAATAVLSAITFISGPLVLPAIVAVACIVWGALRHQWWRPLVLLAAMVVSTAVSVAIKAVVARPRPPVTTMFVPSAETSASFPSGHTIGAATLLFVGAYLVVSRRPGAWRLFCWCVAALIGVVAVALSRLYLGYHFLTDVLAAVALALAILGTVIIVDRLRALHGSRESRHV